MQMKVELENRQRSVKYTRKTNQPTKQTKTNQTKQQQQKNSAVRDILHSTKGM